VTRHVRRRQVRVYFFDNRFHRAGDLEPIYPTAELRPCSARFFNLAPSPHPDQPLVLQPTAFTCHPYDLRIVQQPVEQDLRFVTGQSQIDDYSQEVRRKSRRAPIVTSNISNSKMSSSTDEQLR